MAIRRLLIANRGEIAVRIARTARRMGIATIGVYADPDRHALHTRVVDEAVALGGSSPAESYLRADRLLDVARRTGADAVHPGYGFLAENPEFAQAVVDAGLIWVGPTAEQIALLGDKIAAKRIAAEAGVPTAPIVEVSPDAPIPDDIGFPVMVKAAAGGGGRGMRIVRDRDELATAVAAASREAASAFGDGRVFLEPYLERGRHVEVQILGDHHGTVVHLGERECSIQRRNQKVVEEAPSPGIDDEIRHTLWDGAVALARAVGYRNAGTVEFLVGSDSRIDLLEVNTRLQVEHPVTEAITGLDIVELQLRIADGEPLPLSQDEVVFSGHAIEARLVAEDPAAGWTPAAGTLIAFEIDETVRVDAGVEAGSVVSSDYDSLLAKVIAHGPTRGDAARRLSRALTRAHIGGIATDRDTLVAVLDHPAFLAGDTPTTFLDEHPEVAQAEPDEQDRRVLVLGAAARAKALHRAADRHWWFAPTGWRNLFTVGQRSAWTDLRGRRTEVEERWHDDDRATVLIGRWPRPTETGALEPDERTPVELRVVHHGGEVVAVEVDGVRHDLRLAGDPTTGLVVSGPRGGSTLRLEPRFVPHEPDEAGSGPVAPLPGTIVAVEVAPGDEVEEGATLVVLEAMKMEHTIVAPADAVVSEVRVAVGERVDAGDLLVRLDPRAAEDEGDDG